MGTSPWFGLALGVLVLLIAAGSLRRGTPLRLSHYVFVGLGLASIVLSLLELLH
jgi:hypothetical protein